MISHDLESKDHLSRPFARNNPLARYISGFGKIKTFNCGFFVFAVKDRIKKKIAAYFKLYLVADRSSLEIFQDGKTRPMNTRPTPRLLMDRILADHQRLQQEVTGELNFLENMDRKIYKLSVEVHKKYSIPVACIVFVLIGAPLGIMSRRGSMAMAGGVSFAFFLLYWASLIGGEELADNRFISPFMAMWLANILVGIGGLYLVYHSIYEATGLTSIAPLAALKRFWLRLRKKQL